MRQTLSNHPLHNPFYNRFNEPVTHRRDEMQSYENTVCVREHNKTSKAQANAVWSSISDEQTTSILNAERLSHVGSIVAEAFALLLVLLVSVSMLKAF